MKPQCALPLLFEYKIVVHDLTRAPAPFCGLAFVDPWPDDIDRRELLTADIFDGKEDLPAVRVETIPGIADRLTVYRAGPIRRCGRRGAIPHHRILRFTWMDQLLRQAQVGTG